MEVRQIDCYLECLGQLSTATMILWPSSLSACLVSILTRGIFFSAATKMWRHEPFIHSKTRLKGCCDMEQTLGVAYGRTDELIRVRELVGCKNASHLKRIITVKMFQFFFAIQITLIGFGCSIPQYCRHFRLSQQCCTLKKYRMYQRTVPVQDVPKICIKILSSFL